jgi:hypothetical protein
MICHDVGNMISWKHKNNTLMLPCGTLARKKHLFHNSFSVLHSKYFVGNDLTNQPEAFGTREPARL